VRPTTEEIELGADLDHPQNDKTEPGGRIHAAWNPAFLFGSDFRITVLSRPDASGHGVELNLNATIGENDHPCIIVDYPEAGVK
jgi:hypothetical protein